MLHERVSPQTLAAARIFVFGLWLVIVWSRPLTDLAELPLWIHSPVGPMRALPGAVWPILLAAPVLAAIRYLLLVGLALLVLGVRGFHVIAVATCALLTLFLGLPRAFLIIATHRELALLFAAYVLACFPCADAYALRRRLRAPRPGSLYRAAMVTVTLVLLLTYAMPAARRLAAGGLTIFLDGSIVHYTAVRASEPGAFTPELGLRVVQDPWLRAGMQVGFPLVTVFELLSPLCLFHRAFRRVWIVVIGSFHIMSWLTMGIFFWANMLMIVFFVTDIDRILARWRRPVEPALMSRAPSSRPTL
jgi:hypothetical protein